MFGRLTLKQTPLPPPQYLTNRDEPRKGVVAIDSPPLCHRCAERNVLCSSCKGEQQATYTLGQLNLDEGRPDLPVQYRISKIDHIPPAAAHRPEDTLERAPQTTCPKPPIWMRLLPSNVNADVRPPRHSVLERRLSFPYIEHTRYSTPFSTPTEYRKGSDVQAAELSKALQELPQQLQSIARRRTVQISSQTSTFPRPTRKRVKFDSVNLTSRIDMPTPDLTQSPSTPVSAFPRAHQPRSHGPGTPDTPAPIGRPSSCALEIKSSGKQDVPNPQNEMAPLQRTHGKPIEFLGAPLSGFYTSASAPEARVASFAVKPTFLKELSSFFASRTGKWILPSRVNQGKYWPEQADGVFGIERP